MKITRPRKIVAARRRHDFTQIELAMLLGCTQQYVSRVERGLERQCSEQFAADLARRLDLDPRDVFDGVPSTKRKRRPKTGAAV